MGMSKSLISMRVYVQNTCRLQFISVLKDIIHEKIEAEVKEDGSKRRRNLYFDH